MIQHAEAGRVPPAHAAAMRAEIAKIPDAFGDKSLKQKLENILKKVEEGLIAVPMMAFGWTRELWEGTASVIRGRGTISGPVPLELSSVFASKERFHVADMRRTVSSVGPDLGGSRHR